VTPFAPQILNHRLNRGKEILRGWPSDGRDQRSPTRRTAGLGARRERRRGATVIPLIERIRTRTSPSSHLRNVTSALLAEHRMRGCDHQFIPLDAPSFVTRFLDHWRPDLALFVESDLWPNLIISSAQRSIPMILVNGPCPIGVSPWRYLPGTIEALLRRFDLCLVRSTADAERYGELGAPRLDTTEISARRAGAAGGPAQTRHARWRPCRPYDHRRGLYPSGEKPP